MDKNVVFILLVSKDMGRAEEELAEEELTKIINEAKKARYWKFNSVKRTTVMDLE